MKVISGVEGVGNSTNIKFNNLMCVCVCVCVCVCTYVRDGTIQGTGVSMHHAKSITIPRYITTLEHLPKCNDIISQV